MRGAAAHGASLPSTRGLCRRPDAHAIQGGICAFAGRCSWRRACRAVACRPPSDRIPRFWLDLNARRRPRELVRIQVSRAVPAEQRQAAAGGILARGRHPGARARRTSACDGPRALALRSCNRAGRAKRRRYWRGGGGGGRLAVRLPPSSWRRGWADRAVAAHSPRRHRRLAS